MPTKRNQYIADKISCNAAQLEELLARVPALSALQIAARLGTADHRTLTSLLANAPLEAAIPARAVMLSANS